MQRKYILYTLLFILLPVWVQTVSAARIKDLANIEGVRENQLMGYGLVIGLNGTGDDIKKSVFTRQAMINMIKRMGMAITPDVFSQMKTKNVAAVMVTAKLPPFARAGSTIDIHVASIGDSSSLAGGNLLMTPLKGPDGKTYAVAQGPLAVGGISFGGKAAQVQKNFPTAGRIAGGAIIERTVNFALPTDGNLLFQLKETDFTTATRMTEAINDQFGDATAQSLDGTSIQVIQPDDYPGGLVSFISEIENISISPDTPARIVVNERTGTIVMGQDVRISTVAVSHGNLNLVISESIEVSQPNPLAAGETVAAPQTTIEVVEEDGNLVVLEMGVNIGDIAKALNAIGATPRDLIAIFQAIKAAGALQGELVVL
ncbi:flagellar basal body P-ring protein FlgI [Desulfogranum marinum]|uniref:flagellar basal body P-ring protein FlgI n=1 Tax=Desulfogranum marinum TaxID=453220 RepID=UPI001964098C|nr:flagellar basal body P-ring protein FlgI [Desulfogranum marinum]MBM9513164.1 flagellar basal body P-ring protein FlgI [Desulfogranum marinum]